MARTEGALARGLGSWPRIAVVAALLLASFILWLTVDDAEVGVGFLFLAPVLLAGLWGGGRAGLVTGVLAGLLFGVAASIVDAENVALSAAIRAAIYGGLGYLVGMLIEQRVELRGLLAAQRRELVELRAIQDALVPGELPKRPELELASCYLPAQEGVAGDFFIVAPGPGDSTVVVVGDVVGKGLEAARRASFVRAALATFAPFTDDPVRLLHMANYSLIEKAGTSQTFVTAACATYHPGDGRMVYASAGHPAPLQLDGGTPLETDPGVPLGIDVDVGGSAREVRLGPGAGVLLYTDGLLEARRPGDDGTTMLGEERVAALLRELRGAAPGAVVSRLRREAEEHAGGVLPDDLCMVALRAVRPAPPR